MLTLAPAIIAILFAYYLALAEIYQKSAVVADIVTDRVVKTSAQLGAAFEDLRHVDPGAECSATAIARMVDNDLQSSLIQAFGFAAGDRLVCSSYGPAAQAIPLGEPDYVSATGMRIRRARKLPLSSHESFLLVSEPRGFTAIIHPKLILILNAPSTEFSLGVSGLSSNMALLQQGKFSITREQASSLVTKGAEGRETIAGQTVVWRHPKGLDLLVYVAAPQSETWWAFGKALLWLLPLGLLCGGATQFLLRKLAAHQSSLATLLRKGLRQEELFLVYQPIVDLRDGSWIGAETLLRWRRSDGDLVSPDIFIPIAEKNGLMAELTEFVVTRALRDYAPLMRGPEGPLFLSLNFSMTNLISSDMRAKLLAATERSGADPALVHIELTEREEVQIDEASAAIAGLKARGFRLGSDDFGAGYSNLNTLDAFNVDFLKLDKGLTKAYQGSPKAGEVGDLVIEIARTRHIEIIAEGIETEQQAEALRARGVHMGQGWHYGRPVPIEVFRTEFTALKRAQADAGPMPVPGSVIA